MVGRVKRALALHYLTCGLHTLMRSQNAQSTWRNMVQSCGALCCATTDVEGGRVLVTRIHKPCLALQIVCSVHAPAAVKSRASPLCLSSAALGSSSAEWQAHH